MTALLVIIGIVWLAWAIGNADADHPPWLKLLEPPATLLVLFVTGVILVGRWVGRK